MTTASNRIVVKYVGIADQVNDHVLALKLVLMFLELSLNQ